MIRRLALLTSAVLALAPLAAVPAHADSWTGHDVLGDAIAYTFDPEPEPCGTTTETPTDDGDIRRLRVRHTRDTVELRLTVSGLTDPRRTSAVLTVRTSKRDWSIGIYQYRSRDEVLITAAPDLTEVEDTPNGNGNGDGDGDGNGNGDCNFGDVAFVRPCPGATGSIRVDQGVVVASVPRRCLGTPRWVRVGAAVSTWDGRDGASTYDTWAPPAVDDGDRGTRVLGPRVRAAR